AGEGGEVDDGRGVVLTGAVGEGVGEDEAAFGVGVGHFGGDAVVEGEDVVDAVGGGVDHVFGAGDDADDALGQVEPGDGLHGADDAHPAALVVLHAGHAAGGLHGVAAGIEGDRLADEEDGLGSA